MLELYKTAKSMLERYKWVNAASLVAQHNLFHVHFTPKASVHGLEHDPMGWNRIMVWILCWSMIFSENRHPLYPDHALASSAASGNPWTLLN